MSPNSRGYLQVKPPNFQEQHHYHVHHHHRSYILLIECKCLNHSYIKVQYTHRYTAMTWYGVDEFYLILKSSDGMIALFCFCFNFLQSDSLSNILDLTNSTWLCHRESIMYKIGYDELGLILSGVIALDYMVKRILHNHLKRSITFGWNW